MITQELVRNLFDYKDGNLFRKQSVPKAKAGTKAGVLMTDKTTGYTRYKVGINNKEYYVHRIIFLYHHGYLPKIIDHINGDASDNRIENLRPANQSQNLSNAKLSTANTSGIKGVYWDKKLKKWRAKVMLNYKSICIGSYATLEEAAKAVTIKRKELHKEFARNE